MESEKFMVNNDVGRMIATRYVTETFAAQVGLQKHAAMQLCLLVEETLGMVRATLDDFYGRLWFSGDAGRCEIHLDATAEIDAESRETLLSLSTSGRNAAAKGFMGMVGDVISGALHSFGRSMDQYGRETMNYGIVHTEGIGAPAVCDMTPMWTLTVYRQNLDARQGESDDVDRACEDLERSIVASIADDVVVGIRGDRVEMVIVKDFTKQKRGER